MRTAVQPTSLSAYDAVRASGTSSHQCARILLTQARLKEKFSYDPETGIFIYKRTGKACQCRQYGYVIVRVDGRNYFAHRLAFLYMDGKFPPEVTDHINGVKDDNRFINLRHASHAQNTFNRKLNKTSTSGLACVYKEKKNGKWKAQFKMGGRCYFLGYFDTKEAAYEKYKQEIVKAHGEFSGVASGRFDHESHVPVGLPVVGQGRLF